MIDHDNVMQHGLDRLMAIAVVEKRPLVRQLNVVLDFYEQHKLKLGLADAEKNLMFKQTVAQPQATKSVRPTKRRKGAWSEEARQRQKDRCNTPEHKAQVSKRFTQYWNERRFQQRLKAV